MANTPDPRLSHSLELKTLEEEADDGTRAHDLLHGKRVVGFGPDSP